MHRKHSNVGGFPLTPTLILCSATIAAFFYGDLIPHEPVKIVIENLKRGRADFLVNICDGGGLVKNVDRARKPDGERNQIDAIFVKSDFKELR